MDGAWNKSDPYVVAKSSTGRWLFKTDVIENDLTPDWSKGAKKAYWFDYTVPANATSMTFSIMDADPGGFDDNQGQCDMLFDDLLSTFKAVKKSDGDWDKQSPINIAMPLQQASEKSEITKAMQARKCSPTPMSGKSYLIMESTTPNATEKSSIAQMDLGLGILYISVKCTGVVSQQRTVSPLTPLSPQEVDATRKRKAKADLAMRELLSRGSEADLPMPTIGVLFSGGGWRAMESGVGFLDGLREQGLLDTVTYMAGLSGGSWLLYQWLAGTGGFNPFHNDIVRPPKGCAATAAAPRPVPDPWLYGGKYDSTIHKLDGLIKMRDPSHVDQAIEHKRTVASGMASGMLACAGWVTDADLTIPKVLLSGEGKSWQDKWGKFLSRDLLYWISDDDDERQAFSLESVASDPDVNNGNKPVILCTCIADGRQEADRLYDWVDITPWTTRRTDPAPASFATSGVRAAIEDPIAQKSFSSLAMCQLMAICGSAFAMDFTLAPPAVQPLLVKLGFSSQTPKPVIPGTSTPALGAHEDDPSVLSLGMLRDAGICFNVPFPALLRNHGGRHCDIIVVHDASCGATTARELQVACEQGYFDLEKGCHPSELFLIDNFPVNRTKVFRPKAAFEQTLPVILYVMGLTEDSTNNVMRSKEDICRDVEEMRALVAWQVRDLYVALLKERLDKAATTTASSAAVGSSSQGKSSNGDQAAIQRLQNMHAFRNAMSNAPTESSRPIAVTSETSTSEPMVESSPPQSPTVVATTTATTMAVSAVTTAGPHAKKRQAFLTELQKGDEILYGLLTSELLEGNVKNIFQSFRFIERTIARRAGLPPNLCIDVCLRVQQLAFDAVVQRQRNGFSRDDLGAESSYQFDLDMGYTVDAIVSHMRVIEAIKKETEEIPAGPLMSASEHVENLMNMMEAKGVTEGAKDQGDFRSLDKDWNPLKPVLVKARFTKASFEDYFAAYHMWLPFCSVNQRKQLQAPRGSFHCPSVFVTNTPRDFIDNIHVCSDDRLLLVMIAWMCVEVNDPRLSQLFCDIVCGKFADDSRGDRQPHLDVIIQGCACWKDQKKARYELGLPTIVEVLSVIGTATAVQMLIRTAKSNFSETQWNQMRALLIVESVLQMTEVVLDELCATLPPKASLTAAQVAKYEQLFQAAVLVAHRKGGAFVDKVRQLAIPVVGNAPILPDRCLSFAAAMGHVPIVKWLMSARNLAIPVSNEDIAHAIAAVEGQALRKDVLKVLKAGKTSLLQSATVTIEE